MNNKTPNQAATGSANGTSSKGPFRRITNWISQNAVLCCLLLFAALIFGSGMIFAVRHVLGVRHIEAHLHAGATYNHGGIHVVQFRVSFDSAYFAEADRIHDILSILPDEQILRFVKEKSSRTLVNDLLKMMIFSPKGTLLDVKEQLSKIYEARTKKTRSKSKRKEKSQFAAGRDFEGAWSSVENFVYRLRSKLSHEFYFVSGQSAKAMVWYTYSCFDVKGRVHQIGHLKLRFRFNTKPGSDSKQNALNVDPNERDANVVDLRSNIEIFDKKKAVRMQVNTIQLSVNLLDEVVRTESESKEMPNWFKQMKEHNITECVFHVAVYVFEPMRQFATGGWDSPLYEMALSILSLITDD